MNHDVHLNDEQIVEAVVETASAHHSHLEICTTCNSKAENLRASLGAFGAAMRHACEKTDTAWLRQRSKAATPSFHLARWATVAAAAVIAVAGSTSLLRTPPPLQMPVPVRQLSDEALLSEVQNDIQRDSPDALAPADTDSQATATIKTVAARTKEQKRK